MLVNAYYLKFKGESCLNQIIEDKSKKKKKKTVKKIRYIESKQALLGWRHDV